MKRRDFQKKDYFNPYFSRGRKKPVKGLIFLALFLIIIIFGLFIFISRADFFRIKNTQISGNESANEWEKNIAFIWVSGQNQYYLDLEAKVIGLAKNDNLVSAKGEGETLILRPLTAQADYPIIYDQSNAPIKIGQKITNEKLFDFILALKKEINLGSNFSVSHYLIDSPDSLEITLVAPEGWQAKFLINNDAKNKIKVLDALLSEEVIDQLKLKYIDLRFGEKIYWQ